jgi:hypothetical protein
VLHIYFASYKEKRCMVRENEILFSMQLKARIQHYVILSLMIIQEKVKINMAAFG